MIVIVAQIGDGEAMRQRYSVIHDDGRCEAGDLCDAVCSETMQGACALLDELRAAKTPPGLDGGKNGNSLAGKRP